MKITKEDVIRAIGGLPRGWGIQEDDDRITLDTREHGNVASESAGQQDIVEGRRILGILRTSFPENKSSAEVVDEWVIVTIQTGKESDEARYAKLRQMIRESDRGTLDFPYVYLMVLVESPYEGNKGRYILGELDAEQYDKWAHEKIFITIKNGKPIALKYYDRWSDDYEVYPQAPRRPELVNPSTRRRALLEKTIEKRIRKEIGTVFGGKFKGREYEVNTKMDKIRAEEFAKYKMKYLKDYRQPTDGWMTPDPADLLRKSE